jgi:hypothetical protein
VAGLLHGIDEERFDGVIIYPADVHAYIHPHPVARVRGLRPRTTGDKGQEADRCGAHARIMSLG